ncbi:MAG: PolC-type DNA polymerase III [Gudongella sp.]|nr:PolC-type DNA polymerase III [Gudongella sp.]
MAHSKKTIKELFPTNDIIQNLIKDITITNVEIIKENFQVIVSIVEEAWISNNDRKDIEESFKHKLKDFNFAFNYTNVIKSYSNQEILEIIKLKINKYIKSSLSFIDEIILNEKDEYNLILPSVVAYQSITSNGLRDELCFFVKKCTEKNLIITYSENKVSDDFLYNKEMEERIILKDILSKSSEITKKNKKSDFKYGKKIKNEIIKIIDIEMQQGDATIKGEIFQYETKTIKDGRTLVIFYVSDGSSSISCKAFLNKDQSDDFLRNVKEGNHALVHGDIVYDTYNKEVSLMLKSLELIQENIRQDDAINKRIELHLHTQMSAMDGVSHTKNLIQRAIDWGHEAIAITDHGVVQAFPDAMDMGKKIKIIYGVEAYMINDKKEIVTGNLEGRKLDDFVVFDIETTGLSPKNNRITEIGAIKIINGEIAESYSQLINPGVQIPELIVKLTGITDEMVAEKPSISEVLPSFKEFIGTSVLVAHNAAFDMGFIRENVKALDIIIDNPVLDTLELSRAVFPTLKSHKLNLIAKHLKVDLLNHHRAVDDALATATILLKILEIVQDKKFQDLAELNTLKSSADITKGDIYHTIILVKNQAGLKDLYKLISDSHMNYFHRKPRMPKSIIENLRKNLIIGSACEAGELYKAIIRNRPTSEINEIVSFYDYLEIQPIANNEHLIRDGIVKNNEELELINKKIYDLGKKHNKLVVATGDVHFLDKEDEIYRRILMSGQKFSDADSQPPLYFRTTSEMLDEFSYLGEDIAEEVVILNPNKINNKIDDCIPIPNGTFPPKIEGADEELRTISEEMAIKKYGNPLPEIVKTRLDRELDSIIKNGYAVMYIIAQKLVSKSIEDGYLVGSRGSVGSSFAATMSGITEVNPLPPHYICSKCNKSEFFVDGSIASGFDLPDKFCPECGELYVKDGQDIPFEVFLGFEGDKEPDIDLNFAGEYQSKAHKYTEELFGEGKVFRAGTIGTIADKTAYGFVKKYFEERDKIINGAELNRLLKGCTGIKRSSGQHPGGVMIVPDYKDILDFTPIQYPANDKTSGVITTHFDYHSISGRILKLDILGHDVPSIIKMLEDLTGTDPLNIPLDDEKTMKIFTSLEPLGIDSKSINSTVGTLGIPEFGTKFVRQMLVDTNPRTFSELVRISGLSHGTDVWVNNAQDLVKNKIAPLSEVISTREDIMLSLIKAGMDKKQSFFIMEKVRKGKGLSLEDEKSMRELSLPEWYIESCNKIKYMFPKAHAAAYVTMSFRIAYFKVYHPEAFYATYFTTKWADFNADLIIKGETEIRDKIKELEQKGLSATAKEKNELIVLEVALEMYARGFKFTKVDLYKSDSDKFMLSKEGIIPPLKALEGVGENVAKKIHEERGVTPFISIEDLIVRGKATKPVIEALKNHGCLDNLPQSNQISLF